MGPKWPKMPIYDQFMVNIWKIYGPIDFSGGIMNT